MANKYPVTPDGRYFVVNGRLWRRANPALAPDHAKQLVGELMDARRHLANKRLSNEERAEARARVDAAKRGLGERGEVWWEDGAPDLNRHLVSGTSYASWFSTVQGAE